MHTAKDIIDQKNKLEAERSTFEDHWQQVARYVLPRADHFFDIKREPGDKRREYQYDSTAELALTRFASAMESILTPRASKWHVLCTKNEELREDHEVKRYLDRLNDLLFSIRYASRANFASQMHEVNISVGAFGNGVMVVEDRVMDPYDTRAVTCPRISSWRTMTGVLIRTTGVFT